MPVRKTWLEELQSFAQEFKRETVPPVPEVDVGTGPVQYQVKFPIDEGVNEKRVKLLDDAIYLEEVLGNYWIKTEALLLTSIFGDGGPIRWLPAAQRFAARCELQEMTTKIVSSNALAQDKELATEDLMDLVRICGQSEDPINPAELSLLAAFVPKTTPLMTANGVVLANGMDTESNMEDLERIADGFRMQKMKVDAVHRFVFNILHGSGGGTVDGPQERSNQQSTASRRKPCENRKQFGQGGRD
ncbi:hypothetical protein ACEPPN_000771 [Leptodophora sp. 'Broadleaf-Isolate-01']